MKTSDSLRNLMRACVDDERTLQHERNFVDAWTSEALDRLAREREEFIVVLEGIGEPAQTRPSGSWAELLREAGRNVWVTAAGRNNGDAIATCRHSHARTEARYDEVLQRSWPDAIRRTLDAQLRRLQASADELDHLQF